MSNIVVNSLSAYNASIRPYDALYGPWNSFNEFCDTILGTKLTNSEIENYLKNEIQIGLTVGIIENGRVVEYWNPVKAEGFIKKEGYMERIEQIILNNEKVFSASLNDLNNRIKQIENKL